MKYKITEIFESIQGEGFYSGTGAIFIRFSGCNLNCPFCDTGFDSNFELTRDEVYNLIKNYKSKHLVITGGEPTLQWTIDLYNYFTHKGYYIQIETNGTSQDVYADWITCSPKEDFILDKGNELKVVYNGQVDLDKYLKLNYDHFILQPESENKEYIQKIIKIIKINPQWTLGLQLHKVLNVR